jgi:hypothetical protein
MTPYRRQLLGLPLQRSLFCEMGRAGEVLGVADVLPQGHVPAWLNERGDLFLDSDLVGRLLAAFRERLTVENLEALERRHRAACASVTEATRQAGLAAPTLGDAALAAVLRRLGTRIAGLVPYGILSKFVPDALLHALAATGDAGPPPFPRRSPGAQLTSSLLTLALACRARGYPPDRLDAEWPDVSPEVMELVHRFCRSHRGFGPLAWEAAGYEDPGYVVSACRAAFSGADIEDLKTRLGQPRPAAEPSAARGSALAVALRRVLAFWLDFLERETWLIRRAFYVGMVPLLRRRAAIVRQRFPEWRAEDVLFLEIEELTTDPVDLARAEARRRLYLEERDYLARHGVDSGRLASILGKR